MLQLTVKIQEGYGREWETPLEQLDMRVNG